MMDAGQLKERVAFDEPTTTIGALGGEQVTHAVALECYARFQYLKGGETVKQARLAGRQMIAVTIRANAVSRQIAPDWRMRNRDTGAVYNVKSVEPLQDSREWIEILVEGGEVPA